MELLEYYSGRNGGNKTRKEFRQLQSNRLIAPKD
jgi:hypothetical protein